MFQYAKQNEESLLPPGEGQDEGKINGRLHDPLTPTLSLREREPSGKYPEKLVCRTTSPCSEHSWADGNEQYNEPEIPDLV